MIEDIEKILRFNCPASCDGQGSYAEDDGYGNPEQAQCQWCYEYGMPARKSIENAIKIATSQGRIATAESKIVDGGLKQIEKLKEAGAWPPGESKEV